MSKYSIGIDFGTGSGRVVVIDVRTGEIAGTHVTEYKHGVISSTLPYSEKKLKRDSALQHPQDFIDVLEQDRKSTRLNSSHVAISYAVFCLKKKIRINKQDIIYR